MQPTVRPPHLPTDRNPVGRVAPRAPLRLSRRPTGARGATRPTSALTEIRHLPIATIVASLLSVFLLAGCSLKQPHIQKQTYLLDVSRQSPERATPRPASLHIRHVAVAPPFDARGFVRRTSDLAYTADYFHEFLSPPAEQVEATLQSWLAASKVFRNVLTPHNASLTTHALDIHVTTLHADVRNPAAAHAVLEARVVVIDQRPLPPAIAFSKTYQHKAPLADQRAETLARGWSKALAALFTALEDDLATHAWH